MRLSDQGRELIKGFEGLSLKAYPDTKKGWSIGYGHFGAYEGQVITRAEADRLFDQDVVKYETAVSLTTPRATQAQFDAMVALCYNIGTAGFAGSTVARLHNLGDYAGAANAFRLWRKSDGADNPVLVRRREKELGVYLYGHGGSVYSTPPVSPVPAAPRATVPSNPMPWTSTAAPGLAELPTWAVVALSALGVYWALPRIPMLRRTLSLSRAS